MGVSALFFRAGRAAITLPFIAFGKTMCFLGGGTAFKSRGLKYPLPDDIMFLSIPLACGAMAGAMTAGLLGAGTAAFVATPLSVALIVGAVLEGLLLPFQIITLCKIGEYEASMAAAKSVAQSTIQQQELTKVQQPSTISRLFRSASSSHPKKGNGINIILPPKP